MGSTSPFGSLPDHVSEEPQAPQENTGTQYVYIPPESSPHNSFSTKTVPDAPKKFRHGLSPLFDRVPGPLPSSDLPPVFKPVANKYFMDKYAIPTPIPPPATTVKPDPGQSGINLANITPPPSQTKTSHTKIEEAPGHLRIDMAKLYALTDGRLPKGVERTAMMPGVDLLRKRKTKPRVYEYEPGSAKRYLQGIEDADKRRATMRAFIRATYPPDENFVPAKDGSYNEALGPNQETGLRQPMVGDAGIPDTKTLLLLLAYRAEYNAYDKNVAVRPAASVKAPSSSRVKRSHDESSGYDSDVTEVLDAYASSSSSGSGQESGSDQESDSDSERESNPSPSPLEQTTVKRIRIVKNPANIPIPSIEPADPTPSTIVPLKTPIHSRKRDYREYSSNDENDENDDGTNAHDDDAADASSSDEPSPLVQTNVKRIQLIKKAHPDTAPAPTIVKEEDPIPEASSSPTASTGHAAAVSTTPSIGTGTSTTVESATSAESSAPENTTGDTVLVPKHEGTRKVASAPASPTGITTAALERKDARKFASAPATPTTDMSSAPKHKDTREVDAAPATPTALLKRKHTLEVDSAPADPADSMAPAPKRKYTRKVASAPVSPAVKQLLQQKRGPQSAPTTPAVAAPTNSRQGGRKRKASKKDDAARKYAPGSESDSGSDGPSVEDEKITKRVTRSMKARQG